MSEDRATCTITPVTQCKRCLGKKLVYKSIYIKKFDSIQSQAICTECGYFWALPHEENLKRRTNSTLSHWRERVANRDNRKCVICGATDNLEVHHIIPVSHDPESEYKYMESNGITLCHKHHLLVHNNNLPPF